MAPVDTVFGMSQPRARSLIFDILGDCRRAGASEIRLKVLVQLGELVGIAPENMRVLVARMREEGWFEVRRDGRESIYTFTPRTLQLIEEGRQRIFRFGTLDMGRVLVVGDLHGAGDRSTDARAVAARPLLAGLRSSRSSDVGLAISAARSGG